MGQRQEGREADVDDEGEVLVVLFGEEMGFEGSIDCLSHMRVSIVDDCLRTYTRIHIPPQHTQNPSLHTHPPRVRTCAANTPRTPPMKKPRTAMPCSFTFHHSSDRPFKMWPTAIPCICICGVSSVERWWSVAPDIPSIRTIARQSAGRSFKPLKYRLNPAQSVDRSIKQSVQPRTHTT